MSSEDWSPHLQIRNGYAIGYSLYEGGKSTANNLFNPDFKTYSGEVTEGSVKRLRKCVDLLIQISPERIIFNPVIDDYMPFSVNFITLTVPSPQLIDATWSHKFLLEPFLRKLRSKYGLKHYVWKCEIQERGQIHYHLTTNCFIVWSDIRNEWNNIVSSAGLMKDFIIKNKHANPNSTDVHAVHKIKNLASYICKYVCKSVGKFPIKGKVWDASRSLKDNKLFSTFPSNKDQIKINQAIDRGDITSVDLPFVRILKPKSGHVSDLMTSETNTNYLIYIQGIARGVLRPDSDII